MKIKTTTIGAYPKPSCTPIGDWFPDAEDQEAKGEDKGLLQRWSITDYEENITKAGESAETDFLNAIHEVVDDQDRQELISPQMERCAGKITSITSVAELQASIFIL